MTELKDQTEKRHPSEDKPWLFKPGQSGNPLGRPPGRSLKERAKSYLAGLTDEEATEFFAQLDPKVVWEMAEGKPMQGTDITSGGETIAPILVKFLDGESNRDTEGV